MELYVSRQLIKLQYRCNDVETQLQLVLLIVALTLSGGMKVALHYFGGVQKLFYSIANGF